MAADLDGLYVEAFPNGRNWSEVRGNGARTAYNYAEYLPERTRMMQWYADELGGLRDAK